MTIEQNPKRKQALNSPDQPQVIDEQLRRKAETIALFMGGDYNMTVSVGPEGSGWHWDFARNHVNMDAKDLLEEDENVVKGVASHEGNHRSFTRPEHIQDLWQEPGFSFGFNAVEDPRVNTGGIKFRPGSREWIQAYIERDLGPGGGLDYKGIQQDTTDSIGYVPKYMQWGGEIIRYWYEKEFADSINNDEDRDRFLDEIPDGDVREKVKLTIDAFEDFYASIPDTKDEQEVQQMAKQAGDKFKEEIWPEYKELVDQSYQEHSLVKMLEDMLSQNGGQDPDQGGQIMIIPFSALPQEVQDEIRQKMQDAKEQQKQTQPSQNQDDSEDGSGQSADAGEEGQEGQPDETAQDDSLVENQAGFGSSQDEGEGESEKSSDDSGGQTGTGRAQEEQPGNGQGKGSGEESGQESAQGAAGGSPSGDASSMESNQSGDKDLVSSQGAPGESAADTASDQQPTAGAATGEVSEGADISGDGEDDTPKIPWDKLSDEAKQAVSNVFEDLPEKEQEKYKEDAKNDLETAEDAANEKLRGQMNDKRQTETHKEKEEREQREHDVEEQRRQQQQIIEDMEQRRSDALENITEDPYHRILTSPDVARVIRIQDREYKRIFTPDEEPDVRHTYSGLRPSMPRAMQYEADPRKGNIFEAKGRPLEKSHRIMDLVDMSGSMFPDTILEVFRSLVPKVELTSRHGLEYGLYGYTDFPGYIREYKGFDLKKLDKKARDRIGLMLREGGGGTPTYEATLEAYRELKQRMKRHPKQHNYFTTYTDGQPNGGTARVADLINEIRKDKSVITMGYGIGPGTQFVNEIYPQLHERIKRDIAKALGKSPEQITNSFENALDFSNANVIIMGYMVTNPELFQSKL